MLAINESFILTGIIGFVVTILLTWIFDLLKLVMDSRGSETGQTCGMLPVALAFYSFTPFLMGKRDG